MWRLRWAEDEEEEGSFWGWSAGEEYEWWRRVVESCGRSAGEMDGCREGLLVWKIEAMFVDAEAEAAVVGEGVCAGLVVAVVLAVGEAVAAMSMSMSTSASSVVMRS